MDIQQYYQFRNDRCGFVRNILKAEPDTWQEEALSALDRGQSTAVKSGHGVGKTAFLSWCVLHGLVTNPNAKIPCTAPTQHQLNDLLWPEIRRWAYGTPLWKILDFTSVKISVKGHSQWYAAARSCNQPESLAGFHAPTLIYVIDEASGVPDDIFQAVEGALTSPDSRLIMCGNPTQRSGYFYKAFHGNSGFYTMTVSSLDSHRVDGSFAENMSARWGEDSDVYRVRVLGDFPLSEDAGFFSGPEVREAMERERQEPEGIVQMGIDAARYGTDKTAICIRQGECVIYLKAYRNMGVNETAALACELIREYNVNSVMVDDTGVGGGVTDLLRCSTYSASVTGINFGGAGNRYYANTAALMAGEIRDRLRQKEICLPNDPELYEQLVNRRFCINARGLLLLERKEAMKQRGLPSPDKADALFLAFHQGAGEFLSMSEDSGMQWDYYERQ